jgi:hypothetical protein
MTDAKAAADTSAAGELSALDRFVQGRLHPDFLNGGTDIYRRAKTAVMFAMIGMAFAIFFTSLNIQFHNPAFVRQTAIAHAGVARIIFHNRHTRDDGIKRICPLLNQLPGLFGRSRPIPRCNYPDYALKPRTGCSGRPGRRCDSHCGNSGRLHE